MKRYKYDLSNYKLGTFDMGKLYPVGLTEVVRGDSIRHKTNALLRFDPMLKPVMHPIQTTLMQFFIPHRITWEGWEDFITAGADGNNADTIPTLAHGGAKSLHDYFGVDPDTSFPISALPIWAFNKTYNEFFRDQDLQQERQLDDTTIPLVSWSKDYYTTARPWEQKGDAITIPLGNSAPVIPNPDDDQRENGALFRKSVDDDISPSADLGTSANGTLQDGTFAGYIDPNDTLIADLQNAEALPVNEWRRAFALQRFAEARARYGSRHAEFLRYYGIKNRDARLQRPQMLGGGKATMSISEIIQTVDDETGAERGPLGKLGGHGIGMARTNRYQRFFEEDGLIITLMFVRPKTIYNSVIDRFWLYQDREDFFHKELQFIGQQPITNGEVHSGHSNPTGVFGFTDRNRHLRESRSTVVGDFRNSTDNDWHLGRIFDTDIALNSDFIECDVTKRIFADQTKDVLQAMVSHKIKAKRLVSSSAAGRII
jgi:hypothetical protein